MKKFGGSKNVAISVKMDFIEIMGSGVVDKDMFRVNWTMKGLRGRENSGETENIRAVIEGGENYPVARFPEVFAGEVQVRPHKDGNGYDVMEFDMRVTQPALHKKDDKILGKAIINIFDKVPTLTAGQHVSQEQTVPLQKDGSAVAHVKLTFSLKGVTEEAPEPEPEQPSSPVAAEPELVVKSPPATPSKETGSESGSAAPATPSKEETTSKRTHKKRHSSNSGALAAAALKKKEEEMKEKEAQYEEDKKKLYDQIEELKEANSHLEARVKELEQSKEQTDIDAIDPAGEKMREDIHRLQAQNEELQEQKIALLDAKEESDRKVAELTEALQSANKNTGSDENKDKELALLKDQLAELKAELNKKGAGEAAPAKSNMTMQAIFAAVGAVLGIIIGHFI